jgi:hypothetical protein
MLREGTTPQMSNVFLSSHFCISESLWETRNKKEGINVIFIKVKLPECSLVSPTTLLTNCKILQAVSVSVYNKVFQKVVSELDARGSRLKS